jgi:hypothetical protein
MTKWLQIYAKTMAFIGISLGSFGVLTPVVAQTSTAPTFGPKLNPCPKIYYEEPWNSTRRVPSGCPPNAATQQEQGSVSPGSASGALNPNPSVLNEPPYDPSGSSAPISSPPASTTLPNTPARVSPSTPSGQSSSAESQIKTVATVRPVAGRVGIMMKNDTNAAITYQVVGQTEVRTLKGRDSAMLRDLPTPITITVNREDGGFLKIMPQSSDDSGMLSVTFNESTKVTEQQNSIRVTEDGQVSLN